MNTEREDSVERRATNLLADLEAGKEGAEEAIRPRLYEELRAIARRQMRSERKDHTSQTTRVASAPILL